MIIINILNNLKLYHGCPSTECFEGIRKNGLIPKITKTTKGRNGKLVPMIDSIYLTKTISCALRYAFWSFDAVGKILSAEESKKIRDGISSAYGYVFIINSDDLTNDIKPDEDIIGEMFYCKSNNKDYKSITNIENIPLDRIPNYIYDIAKQYTNEITFDRAVKYKNYGDIARIGKIIINHMSNEQKLYLANLVDNISTIGTVIPKHCYKVNKYERHLYKADGSNFFELAEKIY